MGRSLDNVLFAFHNNGQLFVRFAKGLGSRVSDCNKFVQLANCVPPCCDQKLEILSQFGQKS